MTITIKELQRLFFEEGFITSIVPKFWLLLVKDVKLAIRYSLDFSMDGRPARRADSRVRVIANIWRHILVMSAVVLDSIHMI
jgi:hypothetical protein